MSDRLHAGAEAVREAEACPASYRLVSRFGHMGDRLEAGDVDDARELLDQAVAIASPLHQPRWDWFGRIARAGLALAEGRWDDAEVLVEAAHDRVGDAIGATPHVTHAVQRFLLDRGSDRVVATERRLGALLAAVPGAPLLMVLHGLALGELGRPEPARAHLAAVVADGLAGVPDDYLRPATLAWAAELAWKLGDREGAAEVATALDAVAPVPDADGRGDARFASIGLAAIAGPVERAKALCAAAAGDRDGAVERLAAAVALLDQVGFVALRDRASDELTTI